MTQPVALLVSIASEAVVAAALVLALGWGSGLRAALAAALGTLVTHWPAWQAALALMEPIGYAPTVAGIETVVILVESIGYLFVVPLAMHRALAVSLAANGASTALGLALYAVELA